ncbi:hypothetical protein VTL71DRAFT_8398 [Oculimacula yallundae]|uniref:VOC domain-containing protein n=1 Tax=Oculimacula yallundae TaxID=86028 RepID=A0ABR4CXH8_9HELO
MRYRCYTNHVLTRKPNATSLLKGRVPPSSVVSSSSAQSLCGQTPNIHRFLKYQFFSVNLLLNTTSSNCPTLTVKMPIDHTSLPVQNYEASKAFYTEILKPLSYGVFMEFPGHAIGFAPNGGRSDFWLSAPAKGKENQDGNLNVTHVAFKGESKAQVDEFHANAL